MKSPPRDAAAAGRSEAPAEALQRDGRDHCAADAARLG